MALSCPGCAKTYFISLSVAVVLFKDSFILVGHSCKFCGLVSAKNLNNIRVCCLQVFLSGGTALDVQQQLTVPRTVAKFELMACENTVF